jgi:hypothetical protein
VTVLTVTELTKLRRLIVPRMLTNSDLRTVVNNVTTCRKSGMLLTMDLWTVGNKLTVTEVAVVTVTVATVAVLIGAFPGPNRDRDKGNRGSHDRDRGDWGSHERDRGDRGYHDHNRGYIAAMHYSWCTINRTCKLLTVQGFRRRLLQGKAETSMSEPLKRRYHTMTTC